MNHLSGSAEPLPSVAPVALIDDSGLRVGGNEDKAVVLGNDALAVERVLVIRNEEKKGVVVDESVELLLGQLEGLRTLAAPALTEELEVGIRTERIADLADAHVDLAVKALILLVAGARQGGTSRFGRRYEPYLDVAVGLLGTGERSLRKTSFATAHVVVARA
jgi:hypothetical protein